MAFGGLKDDKYVYYSFRRSISLRRFTSTTSRQRNRLSFAPSIFPDSNPRTTNEAGLLQQQRRHARADVSGLQERLKLNGNNPTLLYGYGGFNVVQAPGFSSLRLALLEQGVVYASANMRGGGEYGEKWHEAGTKLKKQNVFDDFIAAAEWLIANKYTSSSKLAIQGGSNGGLARRRSFESTSELFRAGDRAGGRDGHAAFQKFTIGWNWIADYGSSEANEAEFKALYAYSPIHNVRPGVKYPSTLITTADHDDRVVPAHNYKYAAALQAAQGGPNPILIRVDTNSAHGASNTTKSIEQTARYLCVPV
jgi:prolyl oligopeptidase